MAELTQKQMIEQIFVSLQNQPDQQEIHDMFEQAKDAVTAIKELAEDIKSLKITVYGNGKVGIAEDVRALQGKMGTVTRIFWIVASVLLASAITGLIALFATHATEIFK